MSSRSWRKLALVGVTLVLVSDVLLFRELLIDLLGERFADEVITSAQGE